MAPALTQAVERPSLIEVSRHTSPPPPISTSASPINFAYEINNFKDHFTKSHFGNLKQIHTLITNSDHTPSGLAPPASGRAEGCPVPPTLPRGCTMEEPPPLQLSEGSTLHQSEGGGELLENSDDQSSKLDSNMGFHALATITESSDSHFKGKKDESNQAHDSVGFETTASLNNSNELLALMGRDFNNVNEIIDTLQHIASNPELLDAASSELQSVPSNQNDAAQPPQDVTEASIAHLSQRQLQLERRRLFLMRRLQRITARGLGCATAVQLNQLVRHGKAVLAEKRLKQPDPKEAALQEENLGIGVLHKESMKNMSTSDLVTLVRKMEASQSLQRQHASVRTSPSFPSDLCQEIDYVSSQVHAAALQHVHHDSDATESSSGGESCDENEDYQPISNFKPIHERAFYEYSVKRGWVASRWVWLQTQIACIDEKIQLQEKRIAKLRSSKLTEDITQRVKLPVRDPAHFDAQDPALTCIGTASHLRTTINGYHPPNKVEDPTTYQSYSLGSFDINHGCARTMGVRKVRKRRYIRPSLALKRRRLSTSVSSGVFSCDSEDIISKSVCYCVPPVTCILCVKQQSASKMCKAYGNFSSNYNKIGTLIPLQKSLSHRISKIDMAFHSVLSNPSEILQEEIFGGILNSSDWCQKTASAKPNPPKEATLVNNENGCSSPAATFPLSSPAIEESEPHRRTRRDREAKKNAPRRWRDEISHERITLPGKHNQKEEADDEYGFWHVSSGSSGQCSPCRSPALPEKDKSEGKDANKSQVHFQPTANNNYASSSNSSSSSSSSSTESCEKTMETRASNRRQSTTIQKNKNNLTSSSYDINNIVIPQSMAATSRVEHIQYKEIMTPKWRINELVPLRRPKKNNLIDLEDISDESFNLRHSRSEELERKKFLHYIRVYGNRSRPRRADSSGTNTPDNPLSPREASETSPIASPPTTPQMIGGPSEDSNPSLHPSTSSSSSSTQSTVLTLSLNSLQSSMLKSDDHAESIRDEEQLEILNSTVASPNVKPSSNIDILSNTSQPVNRMKRYFIRDQQLFQPINPSSLSPVEEEATAAVEGERVSPFPSRTFPLKENEYEDLVLQTSQRNLKYKVSYCIPSPKDALSSNSPSPHAVSSANKKSNRDVSSQYVIPIAMEDMESGRDSPLSELTDSAPDEEEEKYWDSSSSTAPDWTISAVRDDSGCYVLQVERN